MYARKVLVTNKTGLHARPASDFVRCATKFKSQIQIGRTDEPDRANAKSIIMLLAMGMSCGTEVEISAQGDDEKEAVDGLVSLIESRFGEE